MNNPALALLATARQCGGPEVRARRAAALRLTVFLFIPAAVLLSSYIAVADDGAEEAALHPAQHEEKRERAERRFVFWPFVFVDETTEWRQFSLIPLYVERATADDSEKRVQFLWPIFLYNRSEQDIGIRVVPFFAYSKNVYAYKDGTEYDVDYMLFPFVYGSDSSEEEGSFALFPVAGKFKDFLGRDEISFFLFPLYMRYSRGELRQRNYLWPVLSFSEGGGYTGFRLWPLFGYFEESGVYRNKFVLWPIYHEQNFDLNKEQSGRRVLVFPIYAREDSRFRRYRSILWPFFAHELNHAANYEKYSVPWPFIVVTRGDVYRTQLWPLYGFSRTEDMETRFVLWPFWRRRDYVLDEDSKMRETLLMPFLSSKTIYSDSEGIRERKVRLWPLWRFRRFEDGSTRFRMLSLLWFDDERGFERQYSPLWTIYERETVPGGASRTSALWGLFRHSRDANRSETRVPLLFSRVEDTELGIEETKILGGLFSAGREGETRRLQVLYFINLSPGR
jgi:hypothetical protein